MNDSRAEYAHVIREHTKRIVPNFYLPSYQNAGLIRRVSNIQTVQLGSEPARIGE